MKPITAANASFWATIAFLILFNLPYIGTPALLISLIFFGSTHAGKVAKIFLLVCVLLGVVLGILSVALDFSLDFLVPNYEFPLTQDEELEVFRNIFMFA